MEEPGQEICLFYSKDIAPIGAVGCKAVGMARGLALGVPSLLPPVKGPLVIVEYWWGSEETPCLVPDQRGCGSPCEHVTLLHK